MKLRVADHAPGTPAKLTPRTRQNLVVVLRPPAAKLDAVTDCSSTSGAVNALELATWMVYEAALVTSFQSKPTGCAGEEALAGASSVGAAGAGGGAGGVVPPVSETFVTKASPQKIDEVAVEDRVEGPGRGREIHRVREARDVEAASRIAADVHRALGVEPPRNVE